MINHFPNFVCWSEVFEQYDPSRDKLYIDTFSCHLLGLLVGSRGTYFSGPQMAHRLDRSGIGNSYFLLADEIASIPAENCFILPFKDSFNDDEAVLAFLRTVPKHASIVLGISSPKQNSLAIYLHSIRPDIEYFCLGAAVKQTWGFAYANTRLRGTGLQWLEFFLLQPQRTLQKLSKTMVEVLRVLLSIQRLKLFRRFIIATKI
jgi:hypothetical protein